MYVTPFYAGLLALWFLVLSVRVVRGRQATGTQMGDGGHEDLIRRIRAHGNFAEYVPLVLLMMGLLELGHTSIYVLHAMGIVLLFARLMHGYALAFTRKFFIGRFSGVTLTFALLAVGGGLCIWQGLRGMALM